MKNIIESIISSATMIDLVDKLNNFLIEMDDIDNEDSGIILVDCVKNTVNQYHSNQYQNEVYILNERQSPIFLLHSYLYDATCDSEVVEAIKEFSENCSGFVEDNNIQTTAKVIEEILEDCEVKCELISFITYDKSFFILHTNIINMNKVFDLHNITGNGITALFLYNSAANIKLYFGNALGEVLYDKLIVHLDEKFIHQELCRFAPELRGKSKKNLKRLFKAVI
ncbi:MAG: hypothetical protein BGN88_06200 [Clostridiales bacterium 43-6]|nr:MAG: hypothetical protein BGN88_06200 [Clostridiales bacterium 43-6]